MHFAQNHSDDGGWILYHNPRKMRVEHPSAQCTSLFSKWRSLKMIKRCYVFHPLTSTLLELLLFMSPPMLQTQLFWAYFNQLKMDTQMPQPQPTRSNERALSRCTTGRGTPIDYRASLVGCQIRGQSPVSMQWQWQCGVRQRASRGDNYILSS